MNMDKVIKEIKINEYTYRLGYDLRDNEIYLCIEIYKNKRMLAAGQWIYRTTEDFFAFDADYSSSNSYGTVNTIKEMFNKLREYNDVPGEIEREYESLFIMYKLNDFKELNIERNI
jgi:hypothetical protein